MVASADLGGLGAPLSSPVVFHWTPPSLMPMLVPWLVILALLLVGSNRTAAAWWIWAPLIAAHAMTWGMQSTLLFIPSQPRDLFCQGAGALAFGFAALWLLASSLTGQSRFLSFVANFLTLVIVSDFTFLLGQSWEGNLETDVAPVLLPICGAAGPALALLLTGLVVRRQRRLAVAVWLMVWLLVLWTGVGLAFFEYVTLTSAGEVPWWILPQFVGITGGLTYLILLPFLLLSYASPLFASRLRTLLHQPEPKPAAFLGIASTLS
jgi:hypothetical protein